MGIVFLWYFVFPFIIAALTVGYGVAFRRMGKVGRIGGAIFLVGMSALYWMTAGRELYSENAARNQARHFNLILPKGYSGAFVVRFQFIQTKDTPQTEIQIPGNGIAVLDFPEAYKHGLSESRFEALNFDRSIHHEFSGTSSNSPNEHIQNYIFCVSEFKGTFLDCEVPVGSHDRVEEALSTGRNFNEITKSAR